MDRREVIRKATERLVESRDLTSTLNRTGRVRVAVIPERASFDDPAHSPDVLDGPYLVEFREVEHEVAGRRLVVNYEGREEFVA